jgi:hypothetical protein
VEGFDSGGVGQYCGDRVFYIVDLVLIQALHLGGGPEEVLPIRDAFL